METLHDCAVDDSCFTAEAFMLDVMFVALGLVVISLIGSYARALRQL
jgi:hypothetical protein